MKRRFDATGGKRARQIMEEHSGTSPAVDRERYGFEPFCVLPSCLLLVLSVTLSFCFALCLCVRLCVSVRRLVVWLCVHFFFSIIWWLRFVRTAVLFQDGARVLLLPVC